MHKKSFKFYTLGCKVNQYDANALKTRLFENGFRESGKNADIAVINTCSVTQNAIRKDRQAIARARRDNPEAKLVLMGCWPQVNGVDEAEAGVDLVWGVGKHDELMAELISGQTVEQEVLVKASDRTRYFVKVQDGCEQFCTYCVIPFARGKLKSRDGNEVISEIEAAVNSGYREIVLTGIHLGLYGRDNSTNLNGLLEKIIKIKNLYRLRLSSIEITEVNDELMEKISLEDGLCRHLHIPLQSGCDKVLKAMNRPYDTAYFQGRIRALRELVPDIAISTDVIVGFPGESEADFLKTYDFVKKMQFSRLHVFPFSAHEKAPASHFEGQVDMGIRKKRAKKLRELGYRMAKSYKNRFKGHELPVIVEKADNGKVTGKTEYYFELSGRFRETGPKNGDIINLKV